MTTLDELFDELVLYWDALIEAIPDLGLNPSDARNHQSGGTDGEDRRITFSSGRLAKM